MFYSNIDIILSDIILNIFLYSRKIEVFRYFFKYFFYSLISIKDFIFIVNFKNFSLNTYRNINLFLKN